MQDLFCFENLVEHCQVVFQLFFYLLFQNALSDFEEHFLEVCYCSTMISEMKL